MDSQKKQFHLVSLFGFQVKEKETARKEYKQAIERGHGAYLMDQDAPVCPPQLNKHTSSCTFKSSILHRILLLFKTCVCDFIETKMYYYTSCYLCALCRTCSPSVWAICLLVRLFSLKLPLCLSWSSGMGVFSSPCLGVWLRGRRVLPSTRPHRLEEQIL